MTRDPVTCCRCSIWPAMEGGDYCEDCEQKRIDAMDDRLMKRGISDLDNLHAELEIFTGNHEPFYDDLFSRIGTIIAMLRGEHDPDCGR